MFKTLITKLICKKKEKGKYQPDRMFQETDMNKTNKMEFIHFCFSFSNLSLLKIKSQHLLILNIKSLTFAKSQGLQVCVLSGYTFCPDNSFITECFFKQNLANFKFILKQFVVSNLIKISNRDVLNSFIQLKDSN